MKNVIKYRLNANGTIPSFLYTGNDGVGGVYSVDTKTHPSPREVLMIGISIDDPVGEFEIVETQSDLENYLTAVGKDWVIYRAPDITEPFDPVAAAAYVWGRLDILNT
jgi:hypothetical protein